MADAVPPLGQLTGVDPRDVWGSEAGHFTPWLAQEDNLRFRDRNAWPELHSWLLRHLEALHSAFAKRVKTLPLPIPG